MTRARWVEPEPIPADLPRLHADDLIHELLARRGHRTVQQANDFLDGRPRHAPNGSELPNLDQAVDRIGRAIDEGERIAIFGDYDADGVTATALLTKALRAAAQRPDLIVSRLPRREEGYGLNRGAIDEFAAFGATLLIAVDCGSSDHEHIHYARSRGMDAIALDHHQIQGEPPAEAIVVSAQLPGGEHLRDLSAVGVAFLVAAVLAREGYRIDGDAGEPEIELLDLVALGTIADMVPVSGVNRALVRDGVRMLRKAKRRGLAELCRKCGITPATANAEHIAFKLGPRLNAAGRMGDPQVALALLLEEDPLRAAALAGEIETLNNRRRAESIRVQREAEFIISSRPGILDRRVLVVAGSGWPSGVLGPVASQLVETFRRPVVVLRDGGELSHGSARSIPGFDITAALQARRELLTRFGGHGQAAGVTLPSARLPELADALEDALEASGIEVPFQDELRLDADLPPARLAMETAEALELLQPFGAGNEQPLLRIRDVGVRTWDAVGSDKSHLRIQLGLPGGSANAIGFGLAHRSGELLHSRRIDIAAVLKIDQWNGQRRLNIEIKDFRPAEA